MMKQRQSHRRNTGFVIAVQLNVQSKPCSINWRVLDILVTKISQKWLAAWLVAVLAEIYTGIKIPTNPADGFGRFYASNRWAKENESPSKLPDSATFLTQFVPRLSACRKNFH